MYRYLEWIQLNFWNSLFVLFLVRLIGQISNSGIFIQITNLIATFAAAVIFFSYSISLIRMGDIHLFSDQYSKGFLLLRIIATGVLGAGLLYTVVLGIMDFFI